MPCPRATTNYNIPRCTTATNLPTRISVRDSETVDDQIIILPALDPFTDEVPFTEVPFHADAPESDDYSSRNVVFGFTAGIIATTMLNPWDRALYLSVVEKRPFLHWKNLQHPYQGYLQTLFQRSVSSGIYYPLEHISIVQLRRQSIELSETTTYLLAGSLAGAINAIITNPLSYTKYQSWSNASTQTFKSSLRYIYRHQGLLGLYRGASATVTRDVIFGAIFSSLRNKHADNENKTRRFLINFISCAVATTFSAPLNFVRNMQYVSPLNKPVPKMNAALRTLWDEASREPSVLRMMGYVQQRLRIGWGTARVAFGMALVDVFYQKFISISELKRFGFEDEE